MAPDKEGPVSGPGLPPWDRLLPVTGSEASRDPPFWVLWALGAAPDHSRPCIALSLHMCGVLLPAAGL